MTTESDVKNALSDHIPDAAGESTPNAVNEEGPMGVPGREDSIPESLVGRVILKRIVGSDGGTVAWEDIDPADLAANIDTVDDTSNNKSELDVFSDDYLTQWRNEGRSI